MAQNSVHLLAFFILCTITDRIVFAGRFTGTPQNVEVVESQTTLYTCTVNQLNDGEVISFIKDGVLINSEVHPWVRFKVDHWEMSVAILTISSVKRSDHGNYSCQIRSEMGQVLETSTPGLLTVLEIPSKSSPSCTTPIHTYTEGDTVELLCKSERTNPLPLLDWQPQTGVQNPVLRNSTSEQDEFTLHYSFTANRDINGLTFECTLRTPVDKDVNQICNVGLFIQYAPNVTVSTIQEYYTGQEMVLICTAEGNPYTTSIEWSFSKDLDQTQYYIEGQTLRLRDLQPDDNNMEITCTASNTAGSGHARFTVLFKSEVTASPIDENPKQDADASIDNNNLTSESLVVVLAIIFICLFFIVLVLAIPICIVKLHKSRLDINQQQRELPPRPDMYYDQYNVFNSGNNDGTPNQNTIRYKTMCSTNSSEGNFPFETRTLPLTHRLPQSNMISQDSWVMTLPLHPQMVRKMTHHRSVEIQVSEDKCPIYEEVGRHNRGTVFTESKSIMNEPQIPVHAGKIDKALENIHEDITEEKKETHRAISPELNPELIVYAKTEFV